jgi:DNA invertase Pin-like site-specific DNA recombinase
MRSKQVNTSIPKADGLRAVLYARTSSEHERGSEDGKVSIEVQLGKCKELAVREGFRVVGVFEDRDRSGKLWADVPARLSDSRTGGLGVREGFTGVVRALQGGSADVLIVYDTTRVARPASRAFSAWVLDLMESYTVITVANGRIDMSSVGTDLLETINHKLLRAEIDKNAAKAKASKVIKKEQGYNIGATSYGYKLTGCHRVEPVPEQVEVIRQIFRWWVEEGLGIYRIGRRITEMGIPSPRNGKWWQPTLMTVLRCPYYIGKYRKADGSLADSPVYPAFLDESLWHQAQLINRQFDNGRRQAHGKSGEVWWLHGLLRCASCGGTMKAKTKPGNWSDGKRKLGHSYYCDSPHCFNRTRIESVQAEQIGDKLLTYFDNQKYLQGYTNNASREGMDKLVKCEKELSRLNKEHERALDCAGEMGLEASKRMAQAIKRRIEEVTKELDDLTHTMQTPYPSGSTKREKWQWIVARAVVVKDEVLQIHLKPMLAAGLDYRIDMPCEITGAVVNSKRIWVTEQGLRNMDRICRSMLEMEDYGRYFGNFGKEVTTVTADDLVGNKMATDKCVLLRS